MPFFKEKLRAVRFGCRLATSSFRLLPDFIIIGAQKSGTTSLFHYLTLHPQVKPSFTKEVHFFDGGKKPEIDTFAKGPSWYRAHFPLYTQKGRGFITGEASPLYIFNPLAPQRIFNLVPEVKLIALLRNPVERAISHYFHEKRKGREQLPALEAFQSEKSRIEAALGQHDYKSLNFIHHTYLKRGLYAEQLERYLQLFDKQQLLLIKSEDFFNSPGEALAKTCGFLNINDKHHFSNLTPRNIGHNKHSIDNPVREYLMQYYLPHNQRLCNLLGQNFTWE
ncbi:sulfotransferase domain-containing protein [Desulfonatronospira sp.]|uniref:sulfotransferase domain-containing protein n=1 Tax=Desulfonatronospira sp. TaxID=1962951 RepID=UPI0025C36BA9|nr:sulfotransferase domain-containing protein [Desulfonatronospira sp.]